METATSEIPKPQTAEPSTSNGKQIMTVDQKMQLMKKKYKLLKRVRNHPEYFILSFGLFENLPNYQKIWTMLNSRNWNNQILHYILWSFWQNTWFCCVHYSKHIVSFKNRVFLLNQFHIIYVLQFQKYLFCKQLIHMCHPN